MKTKKFTFLINFLCEIIFGRCTFILKIYLKIDGDK